MTDHPGNDASAQLAVGDAYIEIEGDRGRYTFGSAAFRMTLDCADGRPALAIFENCAAGQVGQPAGCEHGYVSDVRAGSSALFDLRLDGEPERWQVTGASASQVDAGGRAAAQLDLYLASPRARVNLRLVIHPGSGVVRYGLEVENCGPQPLELGRPILFSLAWAAGAPGEFVHRWLIGANNQDDAGLLQGAPVEDGYSRAIAGEKTYHYIPWLALQRTGEARDGWCAWLDYLGPWQMRVERAASGAAMATVEATIERTLQPGESLKLPLVTLGVFAGDLDDPMERMYRWQYTYLWDYTNHEYYARMPWDTSWYMFARNLQENFAGRLAHLDMDFADMLRTTGLDMLWDDAGWSEDVDIWAPSREGPDFGHTVRYLARMDIKWLLWFCGHPTPELMDGKQGAWGNFQWRTDGQGWFDWDLDRRRRSSVQHFLDAHPRSSFHTCDGGSGYAHTFEFQRLADANMLADPGTGDQTNYYYSYFEIADRWMDVMPPWNSKGVYLPDTARQILTMAPAWNLETTAEGLERLRRVAEIYRFLLREGVAGRWAYMHHPRVEGDVEYYYAQRTSYDRTKACIVIKHLSHGTDTVVIYPRGLLPERGYAVEFDSRRAEALPIRLDWSDDGAAEPIERTGADLMANGVKISIQSRMPDDLIYLGLPNRPGSGRDQTPPQAPERVLVRRETNIGHSGVGVYWSPGDDDNWLSYYEVQRDNRLLGKASLGTYYFDRSEGWDPATRYDLRSVDGDGNVSPWTAAARLPDQPREYAALGGLFAQAGREGWCAEVSANGETFMPMRWQRAAFSSAGDIGGTACQPGGVEGYWEGPDGARVGRGWQQAGASGLCSRTWVAPVAGRVRVLGRVAREYYRRGDPVPIRAEILRGTSRVWPAEGWGSVPADDLTGCAHDLVLDVAAGEAVRFVIEAGDAAGAVIDNAAQAAAIVAWMPRIVEVGTAPSEGSGGDPVRAVRIHCGADQPYVDVAGNRWSADLYYQGGQPGRARLPVTRCYDGVLAGIGRGAELVDPALYEGGRYGPDFSYRIPLPPGLYSLRLKWAETEYPWSFARPINFDVNGRRLLTNLDVRQAARGAGVAYERVFHYLVPDAAGELVLRFSGGWDALQETNVAMVQAIEVLPEEKSLVRINCGAAADHIDWASEVWAADPGCGGGRSLRSTAPVAQATPTLYDQDLYRSAAAGRELAYALAARPGSYTVHLKFAELWLPEPGGRTLHVEVNGRRLLDNWDPGRAAGQTGMAADVRFEDIAPDPFGRITIRVLAAGSADAILQGIEVL